MSELSDPEIISRFVVRARRIKAHSLVQDRDALAAHSRGSFDVQLSVTGEASITRKLPQDEEVFESLAARVRPLTLSSEPLHYVKVLEALSRLIAAADQGSDEQVRLDKLSRAWESAELQGTQIQAYAVQSMNLDGSEATPIVSDTQLAAGWMYADLVHADAKGNKKHALSFPLRERYAAAVRIFSELAGLTVVTLRFVEHLRSNSVISVPEDAWEQDVVVGASALVEKSRLMTAPVGTGVPDLRDANRGLGEEWKPVNITDLLREDPTKQVRVELRRADGSTVAEYDAAVARAKVDGQVLRWDVLAAGSVMLPFAFRIDGEVLIDPELGEWKAFESSNRLLLSSNVLLLNMHEADTMVMEVGGEPFLTLGTPDLDGDQLLHIQVHTETVADIVQIEELTRQELAPCTGGYDDRERVWLRIARLVHEGQVVQGVRGPVTATSLSGNPPPGTLLDAHTVNVGGAEIPVPRLWMRHPKMRARELGPAPDAGSEAHRFELVPPSGERMPVWSQEARAVASDEDLRDPLGWGLIGIDESTFPL